MKRRSFVKASFLTGMVSSLVPEIGSASKANEEQKKALREFYELKVYSLKNEVQQKLVENYFQNAAIPAYNRLGSKNIGAFTELTPKGQTKLYIIIPFKSMGDFMKVQATLSKDATYLEAAGDYLNAPATEPAYERMESSLLRAFEKMPELAVPEHKSRLFELRRYESAGEMAGKKKIEMFNTVGEIDIFKRIGLTPVFFGETLFGSSMPNLTYMLTFDDMPEHDKNWKLFGSDPEWKRISAIPEYADAKIVSHISSTFLVPATFSQI